MTTNPLDLTRSPLPVLHLVEHDESSRDLDTVVVLVVHGWTDADLHALRCAQRAGFDVVVVQNDVHAHGEVPDGRARGSHVVELADPSFAGACHAGAEVAIALGASRLLFTQSDCDWTRRAVVVGASVLDAHMVATGERAAVGPSGGVIPSWPSTRSDPVVHEVGLQGFPGARLDQPVAVDFVAGFWLLVDVVAYQRSGGWDPGYPLYWEDVDLGMRLASTGTRPLVINLPVAHERGGTIRRVLDGGVREARRLVGRDRFVGAWRNACCGPSPGISTARGQHADDEVRHGGPVSDQR